MSWSYRRADEQEKRIERASEIKAKTLVVLTATPERDGAQLALKDTAHSVQSIDIRFPAALGIAPRTSVLEPHIKAEWFAAAILKATDKGPDAQQGRLPGRDHQQLLGHRRTAHRQGDLRSRLADRGAVAPWTCPQAQGHIVARADLRTRSVGCDMGGRSPLRLLLSDSSPNNHYRSILIIIIGIGYIEGGGCAWPAVSIWELLEGFVSQLVKAGRYNSRSEILRQGVRRIHERETRLATLDASIARGIADADAGRIYNLDDIAARLDAKYAAMAPTHDTQ